MSKNSNQPRRRPSGRNSQGKQSARSRRGRERHLSVRGELRDKPDVKKIARAVIAMAMAQAEHEAQQANQKEQVDRPGAPTNGS